MVDITGVPIPSTPHHTSGSNRGAVVPPAQNITTGNTQADPHMAAQSAENVEALAANIAKSQKVDVFVVSDSVFSLYKLPNGQLFSTVRNLRTGEEKTLPSLDSFAFYEAMRGQRGVFIEKDV